MSLNRQLNLWIAQSESWQAFKDFDLPEDDRANYSFLKVWDDFYITLFCRAFEALKQNSWSDTQKDEMLSLGQGLVIYSLKGKRETFQGVSFHDNMLYAAAMYYLADYPASALLLARKFSQQDYQRSTDKFIAGFLTRNLTNEYDGGELLQQFLSEGDDELLRNLQRELENKLTNAEDNAEEYHSILLALALLKKFMIENIWADLKAHVDDQEHWKPFVRYCLKRSVPVWSFFPSQKSALRAGALAEDTISLQMPTSSGKTAISELIIYHEWKANPEHRVLYLAPYRSLAAELNYSMGRHLRNLGISAKSIYGGHLPSTEERGAIESVNLLVSTPEKMLAVEDALPEILNTFDTIICDEGHLLDDEHRGLSYELLLSRFKAHDRPNRKFVFISAIIPNIDIINSWLGGTDDTVIESSYRPTQLEYGFLNKALRGSYDLIVNPLSDYPERYDLYKFLVSGSLKYERDGSKRSTSTLKAISVATALQAQPSGAVALFTTEKRGNRGVEDLSNEIIRQVEEHIQVKSPLEYSDAEYVLHLKDYFNEVFGPNYLLTKLVQVGAVFHHGDLPQDIREVIEDSLRDEKIKLVVCNTTLAEGVNLPIRTMVLHTTKRFNGRTLDSMSVRSLKNLVGRAGRAGKETKGLIIVPHERDQNLVKQLIQEEGVEQVNGTLYNLISSITEVLRTGNIELTNEILDAQDEQFLQWLDAIDISLIDLLSEDINPSELEEVVRNMLSHTLSYHQANDDEKQTQEQIFQLRADKIRPYLENETFSQLSLSGTSLRNFESLNELFDFEDEIWTNEFDSPLNEDLLNFLLIDGVLLSREFQYALEQFNTRTMKEGNELSISDIFQVIRLWMEGNWYHQIANEINVELFKIIRLINHLLGYNLQTLISSVIRIKIAKDEDFEPDPIIFNWPLFLQYGIDSILKLHLFELGLTDRVAVLYLSSEFQKLGGSTENKQELTAILRENRDSLSESLANDMPYISFQKLTKFLDQIR